MRSAGNGDLAGTSERPPDDGDPEEVRLREEARTSAGSHDGISIGQGIEIRDVVAHDDRRTLRRDPIQMLVRQQEPGSEGRKGYRFGNVVPGFRDVLPRSES